MSDMQELPEMEPDETSSKHRLGFLARIRAYFLAGVLIISPVAITLALAFWLINFVDSNIVPLIPYQWNPDTYLRQYFGVQVSIPGLGVLILFVVITLVGWLTAGYVGRMMVRVGENIVQRMPVVRSIYGAVKQIMETLFRNQSQAFRQAVLVEYPRRGLWTIAFVTGEPKGEVKSHLPGSLINIYVPTTPNPTSGFLLFVPREDIIFLSMTVEEAFKLVISGGIVVPPDRREQVGSDKPAELPDNSSTDGASTGAREKSA
ncbi:MAG: DUF502 domain-containing protein [Pseudomonadota bacterium]